MPKAPQPEKFNSGVCKIIGEDGNELFSVLRYQNRTLGVKRYYTAAMAQYEVDTVIRVPQHREITPHCVVALHRRASYGTEEVRYNIELVQHIDTTLPPVTDLTLRQLEMRLVDEDAR